MAEILGYVFWHRPRRGTKVGEYERMLAGFQSSLKSHPPDGLIEALSFRTEGWPWSREGSLSYEDWYLVKDFASLGLLNEAAVSGSSRRPHDEVAKDADAGSGGVYGRIWGKLPLGDARFAAWMSKPLGESYASFFEEVERIVRHVPTSLWRRQMVLGRATEFCLHSDRRVRLPRALRPRTVPLRLVEGTGRG